MQNIDYDLRSVQEVRDLARLGQIATEKIANYTEDQIDRIIRNMVRVRCHQGHEDDRDRKRRSDRQNDGCS